MASLLAIITLLTALLFQNAFSATFQSVPDLKNAMYQVLDGTPCVRLLNLTGEIGCGNPGRGKIVAPVIRYSDSNMELGEPASILLPSSALNDFLNKTWNNPSFAKQVAGLLVEYDLDHAESSREIPGFSDDKTFPQSQFAPYANKNYFWNPSGSGIMWHRYDFPVFLLSKESTILMKEVAAQNEKKHFQYPIKVAQFDAVMQTTKAGTHNSKSCLEEGSCLPLGGYSVWSSLPPINSGLRSSEKPLVLLLSSMDSASFFRDSTPGADSPLSGMIAMLAAVDALSKTPGIEDWKKQLVFVCFTGEAWGYLGSRRFLSALSNGDSSLKGLNGSLIHQILEVGSVGYADVDNSRLFYVHSQQNQASESTQEIWEALQTAASSLASEGSSVHVNLASKSNPGIPPSSLMSFLHKKESISGILLTEYDTAFRNPYYNSRFDNAANINTSKITIASNLIARALYLLVNDGSNMTLRTLNTIVSNSSLVEELASCLLGCSPGLFCNLVKSLITPTQACANHYVGVFVGDPSAELDARTVDDTSRFIWNFLASRTALQKRSDDTNKKGSECSTSCDNEDEICVGSTVEHTGVCVVSTTRYIPAYSTRLRYEHTGWVVVPPAEGDQMDEVDPVYTESFWKILSVQIYAKESFLYDSLVFAIGLVFMFGSIFAILSTKTVYRKRLKHA